MQVWFPSSLVVRDSGEKLASRKGWPRLNAPRDLLTLPKQQPSLHMSLQLHFSKSLSYSDAIRTRARYLITHRCLKGNKKRHPFRNWPQCAGLQKRSSSTAIQHLPPKSLLSVSCPECSLRKRLPPTSRAVMAPIVPRRPGDCCRSCSECLGAGRFEGKNPSP
jgi:hypothetical protein